jgi:hypothetical protein
MKNSETGKFCRSCGTDLTPVSEALSGKPKSKMHEFGMIIEPIQPIGPRTKKEKSVSWESMISTSFVGVAFLIISIILGVTGLANASRWWFWLLIPAFAMLGTGLAQYIQLKKSEQKHIPQSEPETVKSFNQTSNANLPPSQTEYVAPDSRYKTGDLVPPSVAEGTTRHLEINSEGETMTLPKK